uniref:Cuticlin N-terminal domain-containing protein n=1 Tax=Parascaris equorum TaxID=6256 RepID=A0A914R2G4_PAREQ
MSTYFEFSDTKNETVKYAVNIKRKPSSSTLERKTRLMCEIQGLYAEPGCRNDENGRQVAGITLPFETCNLARTRSLNPRGVFVTTTVVITFHVSANLEYMNPQNS